MSSRSLTIDQALTLLAETPRRIAALTSSLTSTQLRTGPNGDEWSANDVLAHLRACADVWGNNALTIIKEDRPTLRGVDPRNWMKQTDYPEREFAPSLRAFTKQRAGLLAVLESLPRKRWSRTATVTAWGTPYERTVLFYAARLARHERAHVKHIGRIVNAMRIERRPVRRSDRI